MKAILCRTHGEPETLTLEEVASPAPGPGEVLVAVEAAAVNFPDTLIIANKYQFKPDLPFSPGGEVAGEVLSVGAGVEDIRAGDRVIAICGWGGFAEEVVTRRENIVKLPPGLNAATAAALVITYGTTHYALQERARLRPGETLLVLGAAGGTGLSAVELGKRMGARVIAAASSPEKLELCREYGADELIDYAREDLRARVKEITGGRGVDVVYDPVGGDYAEPALRSLAWNGRFLVIGFTAGEIPRIALNLPLLKGASIVGVFYGGFRSAEPERAEALLAELVGWLEAGRIRPAITSLRPLEEAPLALREVADRKAKGKIVLTTARGRASS